MSKVETHHKGYLFRLPHGWCPRPDDGNERIKRRGGGTPGDGSRRSPWSLAGACVWWRSSGTAARPSVPQLSRRMGSDVSGRPVGAGNGRSTLYKAQRGVSEKREGHDGDRAGEDLGRVVAADAGKEERT